MEIKFSRRFVKQYDRAPIYIQVFFNKRLDLYNQDKFHPLLNNHALHGQLLNLRSINITADWRAHFQEFENGYKVVFVGLGTHSQLYG